MGAGDQRGVEPQCLLPAGPAPGGAGAFLAMLIYAGVFIALGAAPGQPHANQFGPPPAKWGKNLDEPFR